MRPLFIPLALGRMLPCATGTGAGAGSRQAGSGEGSGRQGHGREGHRHQGSCRSEGAAGDEISRARTVSNVAKSPYFGLYEAQFDDRMVYTDAKVTLRAGWFDIRRQHQAEPYRRATAPAQSCCLGLVAPGPRVQAREGQRDAQVRHLLGRRLPILQADRKRDKAARRRNNLYLPLSDRSRCIRMRRASRR